MTLLNGNLVGHMDIGTDMIMAANNQNNLNFTSCLDDSTPKLDKTYNKENKCDYKEQEKEKIPIESVSTFVNLNNELLEDLNCIKHENDYDDLDLFHWNQNNHFDHFDKAITNNVCNSKKLNYANWSDGLEDSIFFSSFKTVSKLNRSTFEFFDADVTKNSFSDNADSSWYLNTDNNILENKNIENRHPLKHAYSMSVLNNKCSEDKSSMNYNSLCDLSNQPFSNRQVLRRKKSRFADFKSHSSNENNPEKCEFLFKTASQSLIDLEKIYIKNKGNFSDMKKLSDNYNLCDDNNNQLLKIVEPNHFISTLQPIRKLNFGMQENFKLNSNYAINQDNNPNEFDIPSLFNTYNIERNLIQGQISISEKLNTLNNPNFPIPSNGKYFIIKSFTKSNIIKSFKHGIWTSTEIGNKKLDEAFVSNENLKNNALKDSYLDLQSPVKSFIKNSYKIILFFSVNGSGQFCGVAEMTSGVDYTMDSDIWDTTIPQSDSNIDDNNNKLQPTRWKGCFKVSWHFIKDIPNSELRHIIAYNNNNKPVTNSRDTQELLPNAGIQMLKMFKSYDSTKFLN